jgi:hypothetical protein
VSDQCNSCNAPIIRLYHEVTGNRAPIDAQPVPDGPCVINLDAGTYRIITAAERASGHPVEGTRHTNHFQTCRDAEQWRGRGRRR